MGTSSTIVETCGVGAACPRARPAVRTRGRCLQGWPTSRNTRWRKDWPTSVVLC